MPPASKRSRAAALRNQKTRGTQVPTQNGQQDTSSTNDNERSPFVDALDTLFTDEGSITDDSSCSEDEDYSSEKFKDFSSRIIISKHEWATAEAKLRGSYTGTSKSSLHRQNQQEKAREESMRGCKTLFHYFGGAPKLPATETDELERAESDAKDCLRTNSYFNVCSERVPLLACQKVVLEAIRLILRMIILKKSESQARKEICILFQWSKHKEKRLKFWLQQWIERRDLPLSLRGKHSKAKSLLDDEDVQDDILRHLRQHPREISTSFLQLFLQDEYFPSKFGTDCAKGICRETCRSWLKKLGFAYEQHGQGLYVDGHERKDVVEYRTTFLAQMDALQPLLVSIDLQNPGGPVITPQITGNARPHIIVTHDECIFRAHDEKRTFGLKRNAQFSFRRDQVAGLWCPTS